jgi:ankyrin repeat protein
MHMWVKQCVCLDGATSDVVSDAMHGNVDAVRKWLHGDGRYNMKKQALVLHRAAAKHHIAICQLIIDCGTVSTDDLTSALHAACFRGQLSLVQLTVRALGRHCNIHVLNGSLHTAASRCHSEVVDWLLPLTHPTDADQMRYNLVQASARGDLTRVTQLVNTIGSDVTDVMSYALWAACYWGSVDTVDWLMTHTSADVNYSGERCFGIGSMTSLAIACYEGHVTVVKRLLTDATSLCDVNIVVGVRCNTALHEIIWYTRQTQLHESCGRGDTAAVVDTVRQCDVNMQDRDGMTALHCASVSGRFRHSGSSAVSIC